MPLTKRQKEILDFLEGFLADNGYAPSFEEIAKHFGYTSLATVHEHLENLRQKGYIRKSYNASRSVELGPAGVHAAAVELPLMGNVAAGDRVAPRPVPTHSVDPGWFPGVFRVLLQGGGLSGSGLDGLRISPQVAVTPVPSRRIPFRGGER